MDAAAIVDRYIAAWNERDVDAHRAALGAVWTDEGRYVDPFADLTGQTEIAEWSGGIQAQAPGHFFRLLDGPDSHHHFVRFGWELVPEAGGEALAVGCDVARTKGDRFDVVAGFLDKVLVG